MRHKHADIIHAYAEGAKIEYRESEIDTWRELQFPRFDALEGEYRIKPEPKPDVVKYANVYKDMIATKTNYFSSVEEARKGALISELLGHIAITFDGETGKLKSAEVL